MSKFRHVQWDEGSDDEVEGSTTGTLASKFSSLVHGLAPAHYALGGMAYVKRYWMGLPGWRGRRKSGNVLCGNIRMPAEEAYELTEEQHPVFLSEGDDQDVLGTGSEEHLSTQPMRPSTVTRCFSRLRTLTFRRHNQGFSLGPQDSLSRSCSEAQRSWSSAAEHADKPSKAASRLLLSLLIGLLVYLFIII
ncbi:hypothetical protein DUNSADRAFT_3740 [Dunaliella salina]|uniref:Encoded protein n=1 Tax=Dunaliella salina TaxID=3046 RepID=A0ABQ7FV72_DUNSA|nr:hypothetical protein DUNSADRAFT_3740 [Dunaliella salina]|eukprot:KAF5826293.1 hypothetical protein DUNSADRAFT_3740 [Dunaliella salina]